MRTALRLLVVLALGAGGLALTTVAIAPQVGEFFTAGSVDPPEVNLRPLAERSIAYADNGSVMATFHAAENRQEVPLRRIPRTVRRTILAVEDEDFFQHNGVNLRATMRALFENVSAGGIAQGGSTITQQLVKLSLLSPRQDLNRKAREAILAIELEKVMSKQEILERYLNQVYFGGGAYGIQAAAEIYWGQNAQDLDWGQAALLASLIQNPVAYDPVLEPEVARERRRVALDRIVELGYITEEEADFYDIAPLPEARIDVLPEPNDYFVEEVKQQLLDMEELGATPAERYNALFKGGLRIETTFSPEAQFLAVSARNNVLPDTGGQFTAALVAVTPQTGAVRAMVGGPGFDRYRYNLATQGSRQPGSSFKIFVLAAALDAGLVPDDILNGTGPCSFPNPGGYPDPYVANNYADGGGTNGSITANTTASSNCGFLRLGQFVGLDRVVEMARAMGVTTELDPRNLSLPIGSEEVHPIDMAGAAAVLANGGLRQRPYFIESVTDREGNVIYQHDAPGRQVLSEQSACLATEVLEANVQGGTGTAAALPNMAAAGKTGTAQNWGDAWFVGYTPFLATAVWMGNAEARVPMTSVGGRSVTGGSYPAEIWRAFNEPAHNGLTYTDFPTCNPTRPGRSLTNFFEPDAEDPTTDQPTPTSTPSPTPAAITCPPGYLPGDLNGDGTAESCVQVDTPEGDVAVSDPDAAEESAPPTSLERLLAIQEQDTAIDQLVHRRDHLPERAALAAHEAQVAAVDGERSGREQRREELAATISRLQGDVGALEARIAEVTRTMHSGAVTVPRELQALQHEQESLRRRQDHLETEELEIMEELDPLTEEVAGIDGQLEELAAEGERLGEALLQAEVDLEEELTAATSRRAAAAGGVDAEQLATYEDLRSELGGIAVARLVGSVCGGCHLGLSAVEVDRLKKQPPDALVRCDECGRLLVR